MFLLKPERDLQTLEKLRTRYPEALLSHEVLYDMLTVTINKEVIIPVLRYLFDDDGLHYRFLTTLCGMHIPGNEKELGVVYHLHSLENNHRIRLKAFSTLEDPHFPSVVEIFPAANWMERETYDFYGILFDGHPNLKRILNVDDFEGFPLRKDFPLEDQKREDKDDTMFGR